MSGGSELQGGNVKPERMHASLALAWWIRPAISEHERSHESLGLVLPLTFLPGPSTADQSAIESSA